MNTFLGLHCILVLFISCGTPPAPAPPADKPPVQSTETYTFSVAVHNPTVFNIRIDHQLVEKNKDRTLELPVYENELSAGFDITYEIPLSASVSLFCKGDTQTVRKEQTSIQIKAPVLDEDYGCYVSITNKAHTGVAFVNGNSRIPGLEQRGDYAVPGSRYEFAPHETAVYKIDGDFIAVRDGKQEHPLGIPQIRQNYLYRYEYRTGGPVMIDARPLRRAGEAGWVKTFASANYPLLPVQGKGNEEGVLVFASTGQKTSLYSFDSDGTAGETYSREDRSVDIPALMRTEDECLLLAGYQYNGAVYTPFAQKQSVEGMVQWVLPPSTRPDCRSAYFTTLAPKYAGMWLLAGGADSGVNSGSAYRPYIREIRDTGAGFESLWELAPGDFDPRCGAVKAAVYDALHKVWYVTGALLGAETGAYICVIADGRILGTDTSLEQFSFSAICAGNEGYYLAGEEQKPNGEVYAALLHYNAGGKRLWQQTAQVKSHSYYQAALMDSEHNQLVLAGTMNAGSANGKGGTPFMQAVNPENGTPLWLQELHDPAFERTALVYRMIKAPDYGYVLSLTGMGDTFYEKPFVAARVNARGLLIPRN
ncbi:MAG: hypothetical protein LBC51_12000 [Treponema sp.]|jgi:hypothetical protein|nr:hypothetical protein [Treponema sp.]